MTNPTGTYWHLRINDLSEEQYQRLLHNVEYTQWMVIGNVHSRDGSCEGKPHYHVVFKYNNSRTKQTIVNKFIFNKKIGSDGYYCEPMYKNSHENALVEYLCDKECGIKFTHNEQFIRHILQPQAIEAQAEDQVQAGEVKTTKVKSEERKEEKLKLNKLRLEKAKAMDWQWFEENDFQFFLSSPFKKLYETYNFINMRDYDHMVTKGNIRQNFFILHGKAGKGKDSFITWLSKCLDIPSIMKDKNDCYWNNFPNDITDYIAYISEWDGSSKTRENVSVSCIKEYFQKDPVKVKAAYVFDKVIRFKYGVITMQVHPFRMFFLKEPDFIEENIEALKRRFSIIDINEIPALFSLTFNVEKDCWEQLELLKVPDYLVSKYPHLVDELGYPIYKEKQVELIVHENINRSIVDKVEDEEVKEDRLDIELRYGA